MLIVSRIGRDPGEQGELFVALDSVGAGEGMLVGVIQGAPALKALGDEDMPIDAVIVTIFDSLTLEGRNIHQENE